MKWWPFGGPDPFLPYLKQAMIDQKATSYPGCARGIMDCLSQSCGCINESRPNPLFVIARAEALQKEAQEGRPEARFRQFRTPEPEVWKHFKGGLYDRIGVAQHTETAEALVVYRDATGALHARPEGMWDEVPPCRPEMVRFKRVKQGELP